MGGIILVYTRSYDEYVLGTASGFMTFGLFPVLMFALFVCCWPNNPLSKWHVKPTEDEVAIVFERDHKIMKIIAHDRKKRTAKAVAKKIAELQHLQHDYKVVTLTKPTRCHQCKGFMWGFARQGYHCLKCSKVTCIKCVLVPNRCPNSATGP